MCQVLILTAYSTGSIAREAGRPNPAKFVNELKSMKELRKQALRNRKAHHCPDTIADGDYPIQGEVSALTDRLPDLERQGSMT
ncbi:MAG: hypothetical protein CMQ29_11855 [Gammaproteobacteria bacterium]|nr:hypothetical protein [Gammaproteobacteria bacterium]